MQIAPSPIEEVTVATTWRRREPLIVESPDVDEPEDMVGNDSQPCPS